MTVTDAVRFTGSAVKALGDSVRANSRGFRARRYSQIDAAISAYDPLDPATAAQPYDAYRRLHAGGRVQVNPKRSVWILSRLDDVRSALHNDTALSNADGPSRIRVRAPTLVST